jgi:hypothetical protein
MAHYNSPDDITLKDVLEYLGVATLLYNFQNQGDTNPDFGYFASSITAMEIAA